MSSRADYDSLAQKALSIVRAFVVAAIVVDDLTETPIAVREDVLTPTLFIAAAWALVTIVIAFSDRRPRHWATLQILIDLMLLAVITHASGGAFSHARRAFFLVPVIVGATRSPRATVACSAGALVAYSLASATSNPHGLPGVAATTLTGDVYLLAIAVTAVLTSILIDLRSRQASDQAALSEALSNRLLEARDDERRQLAYGLHDGPVQALVACRLDLSGEPGAAERRAVVDRITEVEDSLRKTMFWLHPYALEELGLCEAISRVAERETTNTKMELELRCDAHETSDLDQQLFAAARELIVNAAKHSHGTRLCIMLSNAGGWLTLEVTDDGIGLNDEERSRATREGHVGLIEVSQRASVLGGHLRIGRSPNGGTSARISVPLAESMQLA